MHPSSIVSCATFIKRHLDPTKPLVVFDIGAFTVNGTLRPLFTHGGSCCPYCGYVKVLPPGTKELCGTWQSHTCFAYELEDPHMRYLGCHDGWGRATIPLENEQIGPEWKYFGLDLESACRPHGPLKPNGQGYVDERISHRYNIDFTIGDNGRIPVKDDSIDVILSTSCFEHDEKFYVTIKEMIRVLKHGGMIYLNVPSNGPYHGFPGDYYRFKKGAYEHIEQWCSALQLRDTWIDLTDTWQDNVGVYSIDKTNPVTYVTDHLSLPEDLFLRVYKND